MHSCSIDPAESDTVCKSGDGELGAAQARVELFPMLGVNDIFGLVLDFPSQTRRTRTERKNLNLEDELRVEGEIISL